MTASLEDISNRLNDTLSHDSADLLADLIASAHVGTRYYRSRYKGAWGFEFETTHRGFHVVTRGGCWLKVEDELIWLNEGDIVMLSAHHALLSSPHQPTQRFTPQAAVAAMALASEAEVELICGAYELHELQQRGSASVIFDRLPSLIHVKRQDRHEGMARLLELLTWELEAGEPGAKTVIARLVDAMLMYILRHWIERSCPSQLGWLKALRDPVLARTLHLIHQHPERPWTIESLAVASGTSRATLARHFSAEVGVAPMTYLTERRLWRARQLLGSSVMSLEEIAQQVGYSTAFSLSKAFKRRFGQAPTLLRQSEMELA